MNKIYYKSLLLLLTMALATVAGCKKDEKIPVSTIDFTAKATNLAVDFTNMSTNSRYFSWNFGDQSPVSTEISPSHFYDTEGTYTVTLTATGRDGATNVKTVQVTAVAPVNYVQGGKFNAGDESKWTILNISSGINITIANGKALAMGGSGGHAGIFQAIQVEANQKYQLSMLVSGSGATDTWFEVYFGTVAPVQGSDYSLGGNLMGLNTWGGCGNTAFNGNLATLACSGTLKGKNGEITFTQAGTVYLVIKTGGSNLGTDGISIDNVSLVKP